MKILSATTVELPCNNCGGSYEISLQQIELSQDVLHEGCGARDDNECYPRIYATLVDGELISRLRRAWQEVDEGVRAAGGRLRFRAPKD